MPCSSHQQAAEGTGQRPLSEAPWAIPFLGSLMRSRSRPSNPIDNDAGPTAFCPLIDISLLHPPQTKGLPMSAAPGPHLPPRPTLPHTLMYFMAASSLRSSLSLALPRSRPSLAAALITCRGEKGVGSESGGQFHTLWPSPSSSTLPSHPSHSGSSLDNKAQGCGDGELCVRMHCWPSLQWWTRRVHPPRVSHTFVTSHPHPTPSIPHFCHFTPTSHPEYPTLLSLHAQSPPRAPPWR